MRLFFVRVGLLDAPRNGADFVSVVVDNPRSAAHCSADAS
ncbi:hypothetical protein X997_4687 [Burkholderia pseudomallei A79C]|nr:hypothetical protein X997_4687 [Burkholderia pseudomallei A79C]